jgi:hypothetical protein
MNNEKYMLVKKRDWRALSSLKVPLKAVNDEFEIKSGEKVLLTIAPPIERLFVYWIYGEQDKAEITFWLREAWDENITPIEIDEIIHSFRRSHPAEYIGDFSFEDIPLYADENGLALPMPNAYYVISKEDEQELKEIIVRYGMYSMRRLSDWFQNYMTKYGLDCSKYYKDQQDFLLAKYFLHQHGISMDLITYKEDWKIANLRKEMKTALLITLGFIIIIPAIIYYMYNNDVEPHLCVLIMLVFSGAYLWLSQPFRPN